MKNIKDKPWYPYTVAICIGVVLFVLLIRITSILDVIGNFLGFFSTVFLGAVIAYVVNPLAMLYKTKVLKRMKNEKLKGSLGNGLAFITVILFLVLIIAMALPQIIDSLYTFFDNFDGYVSRLQKTLSSLGLSKKIVDMTGFVNSSTDLLDQLAGWVDANASTILSYASSLGKSAITFFIAFLLSIYFLAGKDSLKVSGKRFLKALCKGKYDRIEYFIKRCHVILNRFIVFNLLDSLIVGIVNAIFMTILGMPYIGLVSLLVAITNLIPNFGPVIGGLIGGLLLLLVEPWYAIAFIIFTAILQTIDGYIIKPKLFGDSLGISGLWILIGVIVGGKMFGIIGILLAIPMVAILDMLYHEYLLPWMEKET